MRLVLLLLLCSSLADAGEIERSKGRVVVARALVDKVMGDPGLIQARVVPSIVDGACNGFIIDRIVPHSLEARAGLKDGDRVTTFDGVSLASPLAILMLPPRLHENRDFVVELVRKEHPLKLVVRVRP